MKKLFVWMVALNVAALGLVVSGNAWLAKAHRDRDKACDEKLNAELARSGFEWDMKTVDKAKAGDLVAEYNVFSKKTDFLRTEHDDHGLVVVREKYDSGKITYEKIPLGRYKEQIQKKIAEQDAKIVSANADRNRAIAAGVMAMIVIAIGLGFGLSAVVAFVLFFLALLDRLDSLMCLPKLVETEKTMSTKLASMERYMTALVANSSEINGNIAELDKHVCAGINWFGENLPKMLAGEAENAKPA